MTTRNLPNEPGAWDSDFSYGYLAKLYTALKREFTPTLVGDVADAPPDPSRARVFVRHDIDVSLERALPLARAEAEWGVRSTYHVMIDSPFYDVRSARSAAALEAILEHGHDVGLHYDVVARGMKDAAGPARERDIEAACAELERLIGRPTRSLSFHLPVKDLINGPLHVAGRVSGYAKELFQWYISDSRARWREGEPLTSLTSPRGKNLQILIHPIWWGERHLHPADRLRDFIVELVPALDRSYAELRDRMWDHIIYDASDVAVESAPRG
jgi:hypothetical protein